MLPSKGVKGTDRKIEVVASINSDFQKAANQAKQLNVFSGSVFEDDKLKSSLDLLRSKLGSGEILLPLYLLGLSVWEVESNKKGEESSKLKGLKLITTTGFVKQSSRGKSIYFEMEDYSITTSSADSAYDRLLESFTFPLPMFLLVKPEKQIYKGEVKFKNRVLGLYFVYDLMKEA